jgi:LuxR family maltose regulon positive regulatory protein
MVSYVSQSMGGCFAGLDDLAWAEYSFFQVQMAKAEQFARQALQKAQKANQYEIENRALYYLLRISIYHGTYERIQDLLKLLEAQLSQQNYLNRYTYYDITMGWFYIHIGQSGKVASWLKSDFEESTLNSLAYGLETLIRTKYHFSEGRYQAALAVMANQKGPYSYGGILFGKIGFKLLEALCCYRLDDISGAIRSLEAAYELASPNGLDMPFIEMGKDTRAMIGGILKKKPGGQECAIPEACTIPREWLERIYRSASSYARKVSAVTEKFRESDRQNRRSSSILSRREMDVLAGLSQGLTRGEIAEASSISINTVKSTVKNVYNKLGALNRADAVRIATKLGIL